MDAGGEVNMPVCRVRAAGRARQPQQRVAAAVAKGLDAESGGNGGFSESGECGLERERLDVGWLVEW